MSSIYPKAMTMREIRERLLSRRKIVGKCWTYAGCIDPGGYGRISVNGRNASVHRVAWAAFRGDPGEQHVLHLYDRKDCFNPDHLMLGTHQLNMRQRDDWGHGIRGERVATARLTAEQVMAAKADRLDGYTWVVIAMKYGVAPATIRHAVTGRTWRHLEGDEKIA